MKRKDDDGIFSFFGGGLDRFINIVSDMVENDKSQVNLSGDLGTDSEKIKGKYGLNIKLGAAAGGSGGAKDFDRAFEDLFAEKTALKTVEPVTDVFEEGGSAVIVAELPGVDRDDIALSISGESVTLTAAKDGTAYLKNIKLKFAPDPGAVAESFNNSIYSASVRAKT